MGVLGLTPFLQKAFPEVVKQLPDRLRGLAGKKIVIFSSRWPHSDGTLITQRLHFAQVPHNYRHVLGWYNLVKELQDSGVSAICVFDGKERSAAKAREAERRREAKELAVARGSIELDRVKRLQRLVGMLDRFQKLDDGQRGRVSELLRQISSDPKLPPALAKFSQKGSRVETPKVLDIDDPVLSELVLPPQEQSAPPLEGLENASPASLPQSRKDTSKITSTYNTTGSTIESRPPQRSEPRPPLSKKKTPVLLPSESLPQDEASVVVSSSHDLDLTPPPVPPVPSSSPSPPSTSPTRVAPPSSTPTIEPSAVVSPFNELDPTPPVPPLSSVPPPTSSTPPASRPSPLTPAPASPTLSPLERPFPASPAPLTETPATVDVDIPAALATLYFDFRESVHKLASLTPVLPDTSQTTEAEQHEARVEYSMTKGQIQLTADEAKLWEELAVPDSPDYQPPEVVEEKLAQLSFRANVMSQSYERRNNPPTTQTYDESKELLRTMGVPCIDTTGTYEAEALASSLVINGLADYVASEDTDVIVYEAPLIRNLTNRNGPLMMLSGPEIRSALELDRSSFIDFALLLGTDFSQRIKNVGPVRALKFIRQHKSIERVIEVEKKYTPRVPPPAYLAEVELARLVFQTLPPVPDAKLLEQKKDDEGLSVVLQRFGLGRLLMGDEDFGFEEALQGNYFADDPSAW